MKHKFVLATIIMVVSVSFTFATTARAIPCNQCPQFPTPKQVAACMATCTSNTPPTPTTTATATPTTPPTSTKKVPPAPTNTTKNPPPTDPECKEHEEKKDGKCVCVQDFERFPAPDGPCVPVCAEDELRDASGNCVRCGAESEFDCGDCIEKAKAELKPVTEAYDRKLAALSAQADLLYKLLLVCLAMLVVLLAWRIKDAYDKKPKKPATKK